MQASAPPSWSFFWHVRVSLTWALGPLPSLPRATWDPAFHPCPSCCPQQELPMCRNLCPSSAPIFHTGGQDLSLSTTWKQFADYSWGFIACFFFSSLFGIFPFFWKVCLYQAYQKVYMHIFDLKHSISLHHQHWTALITVLFSFWLWLSRTPSSAFKHMEICVTSVLLTDDECQQSLEDKPKFIHSVLEFFGKKPFPTEAENCYSLRHPTKKSH